MECIPNETIYTVEEYNAAYKAYLTGVKEVQYADKRVVYRNLGELTDIIKIMYNAIWGHCIQTGGFGRRRIAVSSKGIC